MFLPRLKAIWRGFWAQTPGRDDERLQASGAVERHKTDLRDAREALTDLIFQKKRLDDQLQQLDAELLELKAAIHSAAQGDREELVLKLIAKLATVQGEHAFLNDQVGSLEKDLRLARAGEGQLVSDLQQAEPRLGPRASRSQVSKQLQSESYFV